MKTLISSLCLLSIVFSTAFSPRNPSHRKEGPQYNWADLGLTEDQKAKLKEIHEEMADARKENFEAVKALRVKIKEELLKNDPAKVCWILMLMNLENSTRRCQEPAMNIC